MLTVHIRRSKQMLHFGLEMVNAVKHKQPMPVLFDRIEDNPMIANIKQLINKMVKYHDNDRPSLMHVKCAIQEINSKSFLMLVSGIPNGYLPANGHYVLCMSIINLMMCLF